MFLALGVGGVVLLLIALFVDDLTVGGDGMFDGVVPGGEWLSATAVGSLLAAGGFAAAVLQWRYGLSRGLAALGGAPFGVALAVLAVRFSRALETMATDATPAAADLVGCGGRIVTPVVAGSVGEVLVHLGGQPVKLSAVLGSTPADGPTRIAELPRGTDVVVVEVHSATRVTVVPADQFWA